jgi:phosphoribosylglycinamide formyltransferase-1
VKHNAQTSFNEPIHHRTCGAGRARLGSLAVALPSSGWKHAVGVSGTGSRGGAADGKRVAVLVSGHGSNLEALLERARRDPSAGLEVVLVASDRPGVRALDVARAASVATAVVAPAEHPDRSAFDRALRDRVRAAEPDAVCLAGFMRILGPEFVHAFRDRIVNTHPSLLPAFPGAHAVRDALAYGVKVTGCTVHLVDEQVDHGPVLFQAPVEVGPDDDEASLHQRIKAIEHRLLPEAVRLVAHGRVALDGRRASLPPDPRGTGSAPPGPPGVPARRDRQHGG